MEVLENKIKEFLKIDLGSGDGFGLGSGDGFGLGSGSGYGYVSGDGDGSGDGYGSGSDYGLKMINSKNIHYIDNVPTIIEHVNKCIAKGYIFKKDFTLEKCYIAKGQNKFAHGETLEKALHDLQEKILDDLDIEDKIDEFRKKFNNTDKYLIKDFYDWHHILTGSCEMGRNEFIKNHEFDLNDYATVKEFIRATENDFGGENIKILNEYYK